MNIDERERSTIPPKNRSKNSFLLIIVIILIALGSWIFLSSDEQPASKNNGITLKTDSLTSPDPVGLAPDIPTQNPDQTAGNEPIVLPSISESDPFIRSQLGNLSSTTEFSLWLQADHLVQKAVAVIDGLSRGILLRKIIPLQPPRQKFNVIVEDDSIWLDETNFARFNNTVNILTSIDPNTLADNFHRLRPLFETAYTETGQAANTLDNRLIAAIDLLLATPEYTGPIALRHDSVTYQFNDPELENLPAIQKQLIRIGPNNSLLIKQHLKKIRTALLAQANYQD